MRLPQFPFPEKTVECVFLPFGGTEKFFFIPEKFIRGGKKGKFGSFPVNSQFLFFNIQNVFWSSRATDSGGKQFHFRLHLSGKIPAAVRSGVRLVLRSARIPSRPCSLCKLDHARGGRNLTFPVLFFFFQGLSIESVGKVGKSAIWRGNISAVGEERKRAEESDLIKAGQSVRLTRLTKV